MKVTSTPGVSILCRSAAVNGLFRPSPSRAVGAVASGISDQHIADWLDTAETAARCRAQRQRPEHLRNKWIVAAGVEYTKAEARGVRLPAKITLRRLTASFAASLSFPQFRIDRDQPVFPADFHAVAGKEYRRHIGARRVAPERDKASSHLVKGGVGDKGHREAETI